MAIAEIRIIVSHKKLYQTLASLDGLTLQPPVVVIADGLSGEKKQKSKSSISAKGAALKFLENKKVGDTLSSIEFRRGLEMQGINKTAMYYGMQCAVEEGKVKRLGKSKYKVVK